MYLEPRVLLVVIFRRVDLQHPFPRPILLHLAEFRSMVGVRLEFLDESKDGFVNFMIVEV
jgi:hypothetical protein